MQKEWLIRKTTVEEAEQKHLVNDDRLGSEPVPFGFQNKEWLKFRERIRPGDELWEFSSPSETWKLLCGRAGISLVRENEIINNIITVMN